MPDNFDKLVGAQARTRRSSFMVPVTGNLSAAVRAQIRKALDAKMARDKNSQADVAEGSGQSADYINKLLNNAASLPEATLDRVYRDVNNWMEREGRAAEAQRPANYVITRVAERLAALIEKAGEQADCFIAYGPAGIGKSTVIEALAAEFPTVVAITAGHDTRTDNLLVRSIFGACVRHFNKNTMISMADLVDKFRMPRRVKSRNVLVVDEAHKLKPGAYLLLMELHDKAQCSIVLVGTRDLKTQVATDDDPEYGQVSSRFGMRVDLAPEIRGSLSGGGLRGAAKCFTVADIRKLFASSKLKLHSDAARMLCEIANGRRGTLRRVVRVFRWGERAAREAGADTIVVEHLRAAASLVEEEQELPTLAREELMEAAAATA
jgi:DNA transposition AAA+ family ATPase